MFADRSRLQRSEEARRQAMAIKLEAKEREVAALQERASMFAMETQKVENLRALRLAQEATAKNRQRRDPGKPVRARRDLAA